MCPRSASWVVPASLAALAAACSRRPPSSSPERGSCTAGRSQTHKRCTQAEHCGAYVQQPEPLPRIAARGAVPHQRRERVAVRLNCDALALLRHTAAQRVRTFSRVCERSLRWRTRPCNSYGALCAMRPKDEAQGHLELLRRHGRRRPFEARLRDCVGEAVELRDAYHSARVLKEYRRGAEGALKGHSRVLKGYSKAYSRAVDRAKRCLPKLAYQRQRAPRLGMTGVKARALRLKAARGSTEVGNAHVPAALHLAQQNVRRLDVAVQDLRAFGAHSPEGRGKSRGRHGRHGRSALLYCTQFQGEA